MMYVVVFGNPFDGMDIVGPFTDGESANDYAALLLRHEDWWVMKLVAPETDEEK